MPRSARFQQRLTNRFGVVGIIHRNRTLRAHVEHEMSQLVEISCELLLQLEADVVTPESNAQAYLPTANCPLAAAMMRSGMNPNFF